jgi:hypothetical protein
VAKRVTSSGHPELARWLNDRMRRDDLNQRSLGRRADVSHSSVGRALDPQGSVSFDVCYRIAGALMEHPVKLFELAGLVPRSHPKTEAERELIHLFTELDDAQRSQALDYMRFLGRQK